MSASRIRGRPLASLAPSRFDADAQPPTLFLNGAWRLDRLRALSTSMADLPGHVAGRTAIRAPVAAAGTNSDADSGLRVDGSHLQSLDTAATLLLLRNLRRMGVAPEHIEWHAFSASHDRIIQGVARRLAATDEAPPASRAGLLAQLGRSVLATRDVLHLHVACLGLTIMACAAVLRRPGLLRWRETAAQMQQTGITAIPVVSLVMFLIGAVMAYLLGMQAGQYGANIYVVDGVTLGTVREFAPLLVATVVAGRSGAAFTAQLGTMKLTEEIDAIRTLGMRAEQVLLLPRVLALVVVLPLLVFLGSVAALAGAALICSLMLDIAPAAFIERMHGSIALRHYLIGLAKAPVFACVIAVIGCSMGFGVSRDTRAIGMNTTSTVVQCIVAVVLLDAVFAVVFQELGW